MPIFFLLVTSKGGFDFKAMKNNRIWVVREASYLPNSTTVIVHRISALIVYLALVTSYEGV